MPSRTVWLMASLIMAVRRSTNRVFEKPAIRAIRASRYQPLPEDQAVPAIKTCRTFMFRLESTAAG